MGWGGGEGYVSPSAEVQKRSFRVLKPALSLSVFHYCVCDFPHRCRSFETTLCHLSSIHPFCVAV